MSAKINYTVLAVNEFIKNSTIAIPTNHGEIRMIKANELYQIINKYPGFRADILKCLKKQVTWRYYDGNEAQILLQHLTVDGLKRVYLTSNQIRREQRINDLYEIEHLYYHRHGTPDMFKNSIHLRSLHAMNTLCIFEDVLPSDLEFLAIHEFTDDLATHGMKQGFSKLVWLETYFRPNLPDVLHSIIFPKLKYLKIRDCPVDFLPELSRIIQALGIKKLYFTVLSYSRSYPSTSEIEKMFVSLDQVEGCEVYRIVEEPQPIMDMFYIEYLLSTGQV